MIKRIGLTLCMGMALSACQPSTTATGPTTQTPAGMATIQGRATYLERMALPPGSVLQVQLLDDQSSDTPNAVLAEQRFEKLSGPPFDFSLLYDPAHLRDDAQYGLQATLLTADGTPLFVTDARVAVTPGSTTPVEFRMIRAGATPAASAGTVIQTFWQCGDIRINATFDNDKNTITLGLPDGPLILPGTIAASGARYADEQGNEFWSKGPSATLTLNGTPAQECTETSEGSPWDAARARGAEFRSIGHEPGWMVEVGQGDTPAMEVLMDLGATKLTVPQATAQSGGKGFSGKTADGKEIVLSIQRKQCQDIMTGQTFPATAQLKLDDRQLDGCGRFLQE